MTSPSSTTGGTYSGLSNDNSESNWVPKNLHFWTVVLEKTLESPLDCKEIQPVNPKGDKSWILIGRIDTEAGTPILWPPDVKNWLIGKDPDTGKDWRQEEKRMTEDEIVYGITNLMDMSLSRLQELMIDREAWHAAVHGWQRVGHDSVIELTPKVLGVLHFTMGFFWGFFLNNNFYIYSSEKA